MDSTKKHTETNSPSVAASIAMSAGKHMVPVFAVNTSSEAWEQAVSDYVPQSLRTERFVFMSDRFSGTLHPLWLTRMASDRKPTIRTNTVPQPLMLAGQLRFPPIVVVPQRSPRGSRTRLAAASPQPYCPEKL